MAARIRPARRILYSFGALLIALLLTEALLSVVARASGYVAYRLDAPWMRVRTDDEVLGYRPSPYAPEHDDWGFRNASVPKRCDVLAIGDSMTYGYATSPELSWPRQFATIAGLDTYNMSFGGYGPSQYLALFEQGAALQPKTVVVGIYVCNDIKDAYKFVYVDSLFADYRSVDPAVLAALDAADAKGKLGELIRVEEGHPPKRAPKPQTLRVWLSDHSNLYGLVRELAFVLGLNKYSSPFREEAVPRDQFDVAARRHNRFAVDGGPHKRTVFLPPRAMRYNLDLEDPRIAEGFRIFSDALSALQRAAARKGIEVVALLIPSKQIVFERLIAESTRPDRPEMLELIAVERRATERVVSLLDRLGIARIDPTPELREALARGDGPFPESEDEHPNGKGYAAIARAVLRVLKPRR